MTEHSRLPPSSAARRVACPGSRALEEKYPEDKESPYAKEGHDAHEVARITLKGMLLGVTGHIPKEINVTQEMKEGAKLYADHIVRTHAGTAGTIHIEERIDISSIHPDCWGTPDCWMITGDRKNLHIWDYKYGHGFVEVFENWQLVEYAAGILQHLEVNGIEDQYLSVNFHIVQPRCHGRDGYIRSWRTKASNLRGLFNVLRGTEEAASQDIAICNPSPECTYCLARHACPTLQRSALAATDASMLNIPWDLSPSATGNELRYLSRAAELLDARISGLKEQAAAMLRRGDRVPFFKLEPSKGRDKWNRDPAEIVALGELFGHNLAKPVTAITPKQAIDAGVPEEVIDRYIDKTPGAMKLVLEDQDNARKIFGGK